MAAVHHRGGRDRRRRHRTRPVVLLSLGHRSLAPDFEKWVSPGSAAIPEGGALASGFGALQRPGDRKSTRLNSSHANISYAVFCLKKKKKQKNTRLKKKHDTPQ